ncbi:Alpha-L-arabinofuranosidase 1 [Hordeum vulgare]|nr:Alpha-L-arabinofuranosidase 1 [Hordeum vulgare]
MLKSPDHPNPNPHEGLHHEDPYRWLTVAYHWDQVPVYTRSSHLRYKCCVNELDTLTAEHLRTFQFLVLEEWSELVSEDPSAVEGYHAFNMVVRETVGSQVDYAPMHDELGREFLLCVNDANVVLSHPPGGASSERTLRTALEKFRSRFHKWAAMLSCHGAQSVDVFTGGTSRSSRARRRQLTIDDIEEEEGEETAHDHEVDIHAPQPSQSKKKKTPRAVRKKKLNSRLRSPEHSRKNLPKGMRIEEEEDEEEEEDIEEEEAEGE